MTQYAQAILLPDMIFQSTVALSMKLKPANTVEGRIWDNQLEAASVAERAPKKDRGKVALRRQAYEDIPCHWSVRFKKALT